MGNFWEKIIKKADTLIKRLKKNKKKGIKHFSSKEYWDQRYASNRNSGPGSYGKLALWKAEIINEFVKEKEVNSVIELGCGDGNQLKLANYKKYIGFDVSDHAIRKCKMIFENDENKQFYNYNELSFTKFERAELVLSLDVIFHLIEDDVFEDYMDKLFFLSSKYVIIYSSNFDGVIAEHVKCRKFTENIKKHYWDKFELISFIPNIYPAEKNRPNDTSMSDFYIYERIT